jgi:predicted metalloprotease with PDZ domain
VRRSLVVGVMGSGHVRDGNGVPHQLRDLGVSNVGTLLPVNARRDCTDIKRGFADAIFALPDMPRDKAPAPRLGIRLEETEGEARLAEVLPGTLAEKTGLQRGDRIVSIAGEPVTKMSAVIAAVRAQPAGTWLPLQVNRNGQMLEFVVKFPRQ